MSISVGFPNAGGITIGGNSLATVSALSDATTDASTQLVGSKEGDSKQVRTGPVGQNPETEAKADDGGNVSVTVKMLLQRMKELQEQLRQQQQQLAAAQAASYPTPEAKTTAVMAIQGQIAETNGALMEVASSLVKELAKGSSSGSMVNTTA
ncbi:hypothetical protein BLL42_03595 [Pseudomonas frederiksbergensis]|uniref:Uncharacterized protein n=1 Tax=Pseudomonas frederiksbergensis TaxID=104087 RepID=A0A1J0EFG8_9PSED|nr:hypothetical protein [Pseudomonas frederiksbergensis]APC14850.1 hypothetical protein BLL42_03595 [Pseudomonas frederiksbergensis]